MPWSSPCPTCSGMINTTLTPPAPKAPHQSNKSLEILCATQLPPIPAIHTLRLPNTETTGVSKSVPQLHAPCLQPCHSPTGRSRHTPPAHHTKSATRPIQISAQHRKNNIIPHTLYVREQRARAIMHDDTTGRRMYEAICQVDRDRNDPHIHMSPSVQQAKLQNREKSYRKILEKQCSKQWMQCLQSKLLGPPGRLSAYVHWHLSSDNLGRNLYRPTPYPTHQNTKYQLEMFRIRTQSWIDYIQSHLHYQHDPVDQAPYQDRLSPLCLPAA